MSTIERYEMNSMIFVVNTENDLNKMYLRSEKKPLACCKPNKEHFTIINGNSQCCVSMVIDSIHINTIFGQHFNGPGVTWN